MLYLTFIIGVNTESTEIKSTSAELALFSSDVTYPLPFSTLSSIVNFTFLLSVQISCLGFKTLKELVLFSIL